MAQTTNLAFGLHGLNIQYGEANFATTGLTVEVTTKLSRIFAAKITPKVTSGGVPENLFCDRVITNGSVTVTRETKPYILKGAADDAVHVSSYNWVNVPLGNVPYAGNITRLTVFAKTKAGGSPIMLLGNIIAGGTLDNDDHIAAATAIAMPASLNYSNVTSDASFAGAAGRAVAAGDLLIFNTSGGTTSAPSGLSVEAEILPTPTSDLTFSYVFLGF